MSDSPKDGARRDKGAFYTPTVLADYVAREALKGLSFAGAEPQTIVDPACGDGVLLASAFRHILRSLNVAAAQFDERLSVARRHLFGVDRCPQALDAACRALARVVCEDHRLERDAPRPISRNRTQRELPLTAQAEQQAAEALRKNFRLGDALLDDVFDAVPLTSIDVILANPPFVNIRRLSKTYSPSMKQALRDRYRCATGNFDLYVLFIERALQVLRAGGRAAFVTPNKLATMKYAQTCRALLRDETTLESVLDASAIKMFAKADVYPFVWVLFAQRPTADHCFPVRSVECKQQLIEPVQIATIRQDQLSLGGFVLTDNLNVESKVATSELQEWGVVHSGASGFTAQRVLKHLVDETKASACDGPKPPGEDCLSDERGWDFIVSGNIDRYQIELGGVRYMRRHFLRPRLQPSCPLTAIKQQLYSGPKIVLAGMSKRLEAALDEGGLALGVQVYALVADEDQRDYLLGLLNSKLLSYLFRLRFAAKRLADDYLAINKSQLDQLPIAAANDQRSIQLRDQIKDCVRSRRELPQESLPLSTEAARLDRRIDLLVFELYRLTAQEADAVDLAVA